MSKFDRQHTVSYMEKMYSFYTEKLYCDFDLCVDRKLYPVHKLILLASSQYFRERINSDTKILVLENIVGITEETVLLTIQFLYQGTLESKMDQLANILRLAEILQLDELKRIGYLQLENYIFSNNGLPSVPMEIDDKILRNFSKVLMHDDFLNMPVDKVTVLLQSDDLIISSEEEAFKGLSLWLKKDWNNRKEHFNALMKCIRLHLCPLSFLLKEVMALYCECFNECHLLFDAIRWHQNPEMRSSLTSLNKKRRKLIKPNVLIVGGDDSYNASLIELYNPTLKTWSIFHNMGFQTKFSSYVILGEGLLKFGGMGENGKIINEVKCLNLITKKITIPKPMQINRSAATAEIVDDRVFIMGGFNNGDNALNTVEQWNPIRNTWIFTSPMKSKRCYHASIVYKKEIYAFGGYNGSDYIQEVEVYSPITNKWRSICPMSEKRKSPAAVVFKDHLYVFGGCNCSSLNDVERFNPKNNTWSRMINLPKTIFGPGAVVFNNHIICFGSYINLSVFEYNPDTNKWTKLGEMPKRRSNYTALLTNLDL